MPFVTMFDDDPDTGRPRYMTYEVQNVTGPGATHYLATGEGWRQKMHPTDAIRAQGVSDVGLYPQAAKGKCCTPGCVNRPSERHKDCSTCRSKRICKCACGKRMSYGAQKCLGCERASRSGRRRFFQASWLTQ